MAAEGIDANAQVFQIRDGVLQDRQSFYLENAGEREEGEVAEEFVLQYYASAIAVPPQVVVQRSVKDLDALAEALTERRGAPVEVRHAERGDKRRILELAERNARLALDQDRLRSERRRSQRIEALDGLQRDARHGADPDADRVLRHLEPRWGTTRSPRWWCSRAARRRSRTTGASRIRDSVQDDFAAMAEVLSRRMAQYVKQRERSPHDKEYDESFASLPALIVIDGGKGQLSAGLSVLDEFRALGVTVVSLAKRIEEVFVPGRRDAAPARRTTPSSCSCSSASATRRTGSRSSSTAASATRR